MKGIDMPSDSSEFCMVKDEVHSRTGTIEVEHNYFYPYQTFGLYTIRIFRFLYNGIIIKHQKTEPTYTKTSLFLCEKRRFFMARREKGVVPIIYFEKERGKSF